MSKEQRNFNIALTIGALYVAGVLVWLAIAHNGAFRIVLNCLLSVALLAWVSSSAFFMVLRQSEQHEQSQWQDVEMPVTTVAEMEQSEREQELHTDGKPIEVVSDEEVEAKKLKIKKAQQRAKKGNIDFEIQRND
jgi:membrane protein implicated in regulation of membrane protease activity